MIEIAALDRPWMAPLLRARGTDSPAPSAEHWDTEYRRGTYDRLLRSDQRHHHRLLAALIAEARPGARLLEVGCGEGAFYETMRPFAPAHYLGIDISGEAIGRAETRFAEDIAAGTAHFRRADARAFATGDRFDAVLFPECIEYLGDIDEVVTHYAGLLNPGGVIGLTMWLNARPVRRWWRLKEILAVQDQAVVTAAWGGAWVVGVLAPRP